MIFLRLTLKSILSKWTIRSWFLIESREIMDNLLFIVGEIVKSKKLIPKGELQTFVEQNRSTLAIAKHYGVSSRTITRRIKDYGLKGLRPKGRKLAKRSLRL